MGIIEEGVPSKMASAVHHTDSTSPINILLLTFLHGIFFQIPYLKRGHIEDCGHWTQIEK